MTITIHQPEYLPYIGFFQRLSKSDIFVVLDDVSYQKNGFINRNKIKNAKGWQWLTVPVEARSSNVKINEIKTSSQIDWQSRQLNALVTNYSKAPYFKKYFTFFQETFSKKWEKISDLDLYLIENICIFLDIKVLIKKSSEMKVGGLANERLINICNNLGADIYISGPGNEEHKVDVKKFESEKIRVKIEEFSNPEYKQLFKEQGFLSGMSIIDLLFNEGENSGNIVKSIKK